MQADATVEFLEEHYKVSDVELCENCASAEVQQHDVEGVPFCQACWDNTDTWS